MESMGAKFLEQNEIMGQSLTPNLDKLAKESLYFSNTYATGTRTVRGIEALNLSIPPLPGMSIVRRDDNEQLHSLGNIFKEKGYDNKWIYGGYGYFDNMNHFFKHNGFKVLDRTTWNKDELTFTNAWGACDEDLFNKILKEADKSYAEDKAFLTFALTISNHRPYTYPANKIELESGMHGRSGGVKYADYSIGKFLLILLRVLSL
jgi:phosphoglycerol transferase MdoB-like AlkP superfamily enzyme